LADFGGVALCQSVDFLADRLEVFRWLKRKKARECRGSAGIGFADAVEHFQGDGGAGGFLLRGKRVERFAAEGIVDVNAEDDGLERHFGLGELEQLVGVHRAEEFEAGGVVRRGGLAGGDGLAPIGLELAHRLANRVVEIIVGRLGLGGHDDLDGFAIGEVTRCANGFEANAGAFVRALNS
jgi:hypothetical protein